MFPAGLSWYEVIGGTASDPTINVVLATNPELATRKESGVARVLKELPRLCDAEVKAKAAESRRRVISIMFTNHSRKETTPPPPPNLDEIKWTPFVVSSEDGRSSVVVVSDTADAAIECARGEYSGFLRPRWQKLSCVKWNMHVHPPATSAYFQSKEEAHARWIITHKREIREHHDDSIAKARKLLHEEMKKKQATLANMRQLEMHPLARL